MLFSITYEIINVIIYKKSSVLGQQQAVSVLYLFRFCNPAAAVLLALEL